MIGFVAFQKATNVIVVVLFSFDIRLNVKEREMLTPCA
jgi:hypothetical protein